MKKKKRKKPIRRLPKLSLPPLKRSRVTLVGVVPKWVEGQVWIEVFWGRRDPSGGRFKGPIDSRIRASKLLVTFDDSRKRARRSGRKTKKRRR